MPIAVTSLGEEGKQMFMRLLGKVEDRIWLSMPYGSDARGLSKEQKLIEKLDAMSLGIKDPIILIALVATTIYTILIVRRLTDAKL
jgi:hypothetical protein